MEECFEDFVPRAALRDPADRWWVETKISDDFLDRLFPAFFEKLGIPNLMNKTNYHHLARHVTRDQIDHEVSTVLDSIVEVAREAKPSREEEGA
jgi:hypothetical protein